MSEWPAQSVSDPAAQLNWEHMRRRVAALEEASRKPAIGSVFYSPYDLSGDDVLVADGSAVSRSNYPKLHSLAQAAGYPDGAGDGSTTFNLPNLENRIVQGSGAESPGATGGEADVTLAEAELPAHSHDDGSLAVDSHSHNSGSYGVAAHAHDDGTLATDVDADHTHGLSAASVTGHVSQVANTSGGGAAVRAVNLLDSAGDDTGTWPVDGNSDSGGAHSHDVAGATGSAAPDVEGNSGDSAPGVNGSTGSIGSGAAHENMPPYYVLHPYIQAL